MLQNERRLGGISGRHKCAKSSQPSHLEMPFKRSAAPFHIIVRLSSYSGQNVPIFDANLTRISSYLTWWMTLIGTVIGKPAIRYVPSVPDCPVPDCPDCPIVA